MKTQNPQIGCYLDQSYRSPALHDVATIELAASFGYSPDSETLAMIEDIKANDLPKDEDGAQILSEMADEAIDWLNENKSIPFAYWSNDGEANAFGLWPDVNGAREDVGFVSSRSQEYPADDFEGEWLHVNDHGNATLYVRTNGNDSEVWAIV